MNNNGAAGWGFLMFLAFIMLFQAVRGLVLYSIIDLQHPECKTQRANSNPPKHCVIEYF